MLFDGFNQHSKDWSNLRSMRDSSVVPGMHGWAGELGHVKVTDAEIRCSCGATGCLDALIGRQALFKAIGIDQKESWGTLYARLARKEPAAMKVLRDAGTYLGRALANYVNLVDVSGIVIGGTLGTLYDYFVKTLQKELSSRVVSYSWKPVEIRKSLLGSGSAIHGAAWNSLLKYINNSESWEQPDPAALNYYAVDQTPKVFIDVEE